MHALSVKAVYTELSGLRKQAPDVVKLGNTMSEPIADTDCHAVVDTPAFTHLEGGKYRKNLFTVLRFHIQLQDMWRRPAGHPGDWPHPVRHDDPERWYTLPAVPGEHADMLLIEDEEDGEYVTPYQLGNLLLSSRHAVKDILQRYPLGSVAYADGNPRHGRCGRQVHLGKALRLLATPTEDSYSVTRMRAAWGIVAIAHGLWTPESGYLLSPRDKAGWLAHLDQKKTCRDGLYGEPLKEATKTARQLVKRTAYRRIHEQTALFRRLRDLGQFTTPEKIQQIWSECEWGDVE